LAGSKPGKRKRMGLARIQKTELNAMQPFAETSSGINVFVDFYTTA